MGGGVKIDGGSEGGEGLKVAMVDKACVTTTLATGSTAGS